MVGFDDLTENLKICCLSFLSISLQNVLYLYRIVIIHRVSAMQGYSGGQDPPPSTKGPFVGGENRKCISYLAAISVKIAIF